MLEPLLSDQWYVKIEPLARPAIAAVEEGRTRFIPDGWTNTYMAWMRNIHDWCISRQLWWGHRIPAWYCESGHPTVARVTPEACGTCGSRALHQDEDVLDTWFSSALWPFSTLGWPDRTRELETFYPTSVMETGHDIIFFWVARMMMMGIHFMGDVPFRTVFLHPMVRDEKGQKMSKTKGNVIDPLDITEKYGADALRFTLAALTSAQGRDIKLAKDRIEGFRAFANKLWNATRFALMNLEGAPAPSRAAELAGSPADRWLLARLARAVNGTVDALEAYRFDEAASTVYRFCWNDLCDWYIELSKEALSGDDAGKKAGARAVLAHALDTALRLLHPMMPFVTEELWQMLGQRLGAAGWPPSLLEARYPERRPVDEVAERSFGPVLGVVEAIRNVRGEMSVPWKTVFQGSRGGRAHRRGPRHAPVRAGAGGAARQRAGARPPRGRAPGREAAAVRGRGRRRVRGAHPARRRGRHGCRDRPGGEGDRPAGDRGRRGGEAAGEPQLRRAGAGGGRPRGPDAGRGARGEAPEAGGAPGAARRRPRDGGPAAKAGAGRGPVPRRAAGPAGGRGARAAGAPGRRIDWR